MTRFRRTQPRGEAPALPGHPSRPWRDGSQSLGDPTTEEASRLSTTFRDLGVLPPIADALERVGITEPFPIQEMTLPVALIGSDVIGQARTGTGKTFAFGLPLLQRIVAPGRPRLRTGRRAG